MFARERPPTLSDAERSELTSLATSRKTPQAIAVRAKIILLAAEGRSSGHIAKELRITRPAVQNWKARFSRLGISGLIHEAKRSGRPSKLSAEDIRGYAEATTHTKRAGAAQWSVRAFAQEFGLSPSMVHRIWKQHSLEPHRNRVNLNRNNGCAPDSMDADARRHPASPDRGLEKSANDSTEAAEPSDQGRRPNPFERWLDNCALQQIPEPVLDGLDALMTALVTLYSNNASDGRKLDLASMLLTLSQAVERSKGCCETGAHACGIAQTPEHSDTSTDRFEDYLNRLCDVVGHLDRHEPLRAYVMGLLLPGERKSIEPMAARIDPLHVQARHHSMHHFASTAPWDDQRIIDTARNYALEQFSQHGGLEAWVVDDTGMPKKGNLSVGVARQYCGVLGKTENCQVAVTVSLANESQSVPAAYRLYLPEAWADSADRRARAGVPTDVVFQTKWQISLDQIKRLRDNGVHPGLVLADAGYGDVTEFREGVTRLGLRYSVGIKPGTTLWPSGLQPLEPIRRKGPGRPAKLLRRTPSHRPVSALDLAKSLPKKEWHQVRWRDGARGAMVSRFAAVRVRPAHRDEQRTEPRDIEWLLVEWPEQESEPTKYWLSTLGEDTTITELVRRTKMKWRIEHDYENLKDELGLDHYEGRNWRGFHHHGALCIAAYAFLSAERSRLSPPGAVGFFETTPVPTGWHPRGSARKN